MDDCEIVSRAFSDRLDAEDFIDDAYIMEVSSPGLGRPLKKEKDYKRSMGKELEIRTYRAIERNREFYGILTAYDDNSVTIEEEDGTVSADILQMHPELQSHFYSGKSLKVVFRKKSVSDRH